MDIEMSMAYVQQQANVMPAGTGMTPGHKDW